MGTRSKIPRRPPVWLAVVGALVAVVVLWLAAAQVMVRGAGHVEPELTPQAYLPFVTRLAVPAT